MHFPCDTAIFFAACFARFTTAAPPGNSKPFPSIFGRQSSTDCPVGTQWYICSKNNFRGCCSVDPCNLPSCPSIGTQQPTPSTSQPVGLCTPGKNFDVELHRIQPSSPNSEAEVSTAIQVSVDSSLPEFQQVLLFKRIPATAKSCTLNWAAPAERNRNFAVDQNGLVSLIDLSSVPTSPITAHSVQTLLTDNSTKNADFTGWPADTAAIDKAVGFVDCKPEIALLAKINQVNGDVGYVYLDQNHQSGWYLEVKC